MEVKWYKNDITLGTVLAFSEKTLEKLSFRINLSFSESIKINKSRYIALLEFSGSKKLFLINCVNIYRFSIFLSIEFVLWKKLFSTGWVNICIFSIFLTIALLGGKVRGHPTKAYIQRYKRTSSLHNDMKNVKVNLELLHGNNYDHICKKGEGTSCEIF